MIVPASARVVVIGDVSSLDRLRGELDSELRDLVSLNESCNFLIPYDRDTEDGARRRRDLERLYASLRGKVLVRLLVTNLLPELVKSLPVPPLRRLKEDWNEIRRRMTDLLNEGALDGIRFITILVTEEGEWRSEHREDLRALSGSDESSEPNKITDSHTPRHRCYLITRMLELGRDEVCHAGEVWPLLTAKLIGFFLSELQRDAHNSVLSNPGLFSWRTVHFVAKVDPRQVRERTQKAFVMLNELLLAPAETPLFSKSLEIQRETDKKFKEPLRVSEARESIGTTPWNRIGIVFEGREGRSQDREFPNLEIAADKYWSPAVREYALAERKDADLRRDEGVHAELSAVGLRVGEARESPGRIFPGSLPVFSIAVGASSGSIFVAIAKAIACTEQYRQKLTEFWRVHGEAARCFLTLPERIAVGTVIAAVFSYFSIVSSTAISSSLVGDSINWVHGVLFALSGSVGAFTILWLGYLLQRARGERARDKFLKTAAGEYVNGRADVLKIMAETIRSAVVSANLFRRQAARVSLHHRLSRVERVIQSEFQPLGSAASGSPLGAEANRVASFRKLVECEVDGPQLDLHKSDGRLEDLVKEVVEEVKEGFLEDWGRVLEGDSGKIGFVPVPAVLRLCADHASRLRVSILERMRGNLLAQWMHAVDQDEIKSAVGKAITSSEVGPSARFFSVDMMTKAAPSQHLWVAEKFMSAFEPIQDVKGKSSNALGSGVIAVWHGESRLNFSHNNSNGSISFVYDGGESEVAHAK